MNAFSFIDLPVAVALSSLLLSFIVSAWRLASNAVKRVHAAPLAAGLQK